MSDHKTNQAMLPPDPGGLNRALDRAAAEHLREVAPHLAPCPSCQAGICAEHGPTVTATTTGERDGILSEPRLLLAVPMPPVPPQPEPAKADAPRKGSKAWAIQEACRIVGIAFHGIAEYDEASDCFCSESPHQDYRNDGKALAFVEAAVKEKLARENAPAPPAEAKHHEEDCVCRECRPELHSAQPPAEAKGEMSPPHGIICDRCLAGTPHKRDRHCYSIAQLMEHIAALRTSAHEAEERAEKTTEHLLNSVAKAVRRGDELESERDEARQEARWLAEVFIATGHATPDIHAWLDRAKHCVGTLRESLTAANERVDALLLERDEAREWRAGAEGARLIANPPRQNGHTEEAYAGHRSRYVESMARNGAYALGADCVASVVVERNAAREQWDEAREQLAKERESRAHVAEGTKRAVEQLTLDRATAERQRREAIDQRDGLADLLAAANARAEEAERRALMAGQDKVAAQRRADSSHRLMENERAARLKAEGERDEAERGRVAVAAAFRRVRERLGIVEDDEAPLDDTESAAIGAVDGLIDNRDLFHRRLAAAEAEVKRRDEYPHPCLICFGVRPASGKPCACNGTNNVYTAFDYLNAEAARLRLAYDDPTTDATDGAHPAWWRGSDAGVAGAVRIVNEALDGPLPLAGCVGGADLEAVRQRVAALRARAQRLVEAGDAMASGNLGLADMRARWAAAKADVPAKGAKP